MLKILSLDPSMSNLGIAVATLDNDMKLSIVSAATISPKTETSKTVRQNSKDLDRAEQLYSALYPLISDCHVVCVEIPHGSQTARAMASYGICVGILGAIRYHKKSFVEVSANEVKQVLGKKDATKQEVIDWVLHNHPEYQPPMHNGKINLSKTEHQADAIVAIYAAMKTSQFNIIKDILLCKSN